MMSKRVAAMVALRVLFFTQLSIVTAQVAGGQGCFSSSGDLVNQGSSTFQSSQHCHDVCSGAGKAVQAMRLADCWCGDLLPPQDSIVDDSQCSAKCQGYNQEPCGGPRAWTVFLTDPNAIVDYSPDESSPSTSATSSSTTSSPSSSSATSTSRKPSVVTSTAVRSGSGSVMTMVVTSTLGTDATSTSPDAVQNDQPEKTNTGGIIAGVVVGVVALIAIIAGVWWFMRKRKNRIDGHQRVQSTNAFATAGAGPGAMDTRLDPGMVQRRDSTGSVFADNQDYSRRILRVANPDNR